MTREFFDAWMGVSAIIAFIGAFIGTAGALSMLAGVLLFLLTGKGAL